MPNPKHILLTIDVEDWFQVENFKSWIPFSSWDKFDLRVEKNVHRLLDLFDSIKLENPTNSINSTNPINQEIRCTFFILGWIAERLPHLVREIHQRGHEVASHGFNHQMNTGQTYEELKKELLKSKKLLEDMISSPVYGYRAPSFSISNGILKIIEDCGYRYDSSYNSFEFNSRYGKVSLDCNNTSSVACRLSQDFSELPISNLKISQTVIPWGGGGYFRLIPLFLFKRVVEFMLQNDDAYIFYMHPWEIDPEQPIVAEASAGYKFRHYVNLRRTFKKLKALIESFSSCRFVPCHTYLDALCNKD